MLKQGPVMGSTAHGLPWIYSTTLSQAKSACLAQPSKDTQQNSRCIPADGSMSYTATRCTWYRCTCIGVPALTANPGESRQRDRTQRNLPPVRNFIQIWLCVCRHRRILGSSSLDPFLEGTSKSQSYGSAQA